MDPKPEKHTFRGKSRISNPDNASPYEVKVETCSSVYDSSVITRFVRLQDDPGAFVGIYHPDTDQHVSKSVFELGLVYESGEVDVLNRLMDDYCKNKKCVMVDVGTNIGSYTHSFARRGIETYSFEPNKETFRILCSGVHLNSLIFDGYATVHLHNNGVTARTGDWLSVTVDTEDNKGDTSVSMDTHRTSGSSAGNVRSVALDDVLNIPDGKSIGFIKIDTQGFEPLVFAGGWATIKKHRPILGFEWWVDWMEDRTGMDPADILVQLKALGYSRLTLEEGKRQTLSEIDPHRESTRGIRDALYIAVPW